MDGGGTIHRREAVEGALGPKNDDELTPESEDGDHCGYQIFGRVGASYGHYRWFRRRVREMHSPHRFARRVRRSLRSLLTVFRPFGAPSPLFATTLGFRLHPASKRRSTSLSRRARFAGVLNAMGSRGGGEKGENSAILAKRGRYWGSPFPWVL